MATTMADDDSGDASTGEPEPPPAQCTPGGGAPTLEVGNGEAGYVSTDTVELVYGPQGGYHVVLGLRATHIDASSELVADFTGTIDGEVLGTCSPSVTLSCNTSSRSLETSGILLIWDGGVTPEQLEGKTATVDVTLTDAAGITHTTTRDFMITPP